MALLESSGKVAGGCGRFLGRKYQSVIDFKRFWAARNYRGPVLRPARLRARGRLGARESPREHLGGSRKLCGVSREI